MPMLMGRSELYAAPEPASAAEFDSLDLPPTEFGIDDDAGPW